MWVCVCVCVLYMCCIRTVYLYCMCVGIYQCRHGFSIVRTIVRTAAAAETKASILSLTSDLFEFEGDGGNSSEAKAYGFGWIEGGGGKSRAGILGLREIILSFFFLQHQNGWIRGVWWKEKTNYNNTNNNNTKRTNKNCIGRMQMELCKQNAWFIFASEE